MNHPIKNTGYIHEVPGVADNFFGATPFSEPRNTLRDWGNFLTPGEKQSGPNMDAEDCVSFAKTQDINAQVDWLITSNLLNPAAIQALQPYMVNGKFVSSARFLAKVSNTTQQGNSFSAVANAVQTYGLLPETDWPSDPGNMTWNEYYCAISQNLLDKAKQILSILSFPWQWVDTKNIEQALLTAPVQIATSCCPGWNTDDPIKACGGPAQHSTLIYDINDTNKEYEILDHYLNDKGTFFKDLASDYQIISAMQTIVTPVNSAVANPPALFNKDLSYGQTDPDVARLQAVLVKDGELTASLDAQGYYGEGTRKGVYLFQRKYTVASWWVLFWLQGKKVGPDTRKTLNNLITKI
jgi:hypothetical protein